MLVLLRLKLMLPWVPLVQSLDLISQERDGGVD